MAWLGFHSIGRARRAAALLLAASASLTSASCGSRAVKPPAEQAMAVSDLRQAVGDIKDLEQCVQAVVSMGDEAPESQGRAAQGLSDRLSALSLGLHDRAAAMRERKDAHFAAWDEQLRAITHEDVYSRTASRRDELRRRFERLNDLYQQASAELVPLQSDLRQWARPKSAASAGVDRASDDELRRRIQVEASSLAASLRAILNDFERLGVVEGVVRSGHGDGGSSGGQ